MRVFYCIVVVFIAMVHAQIFADDNGLLAVIHLNQQLKHENAEIEKATLKNKGLLEEINDLKHNVNTVEARARRDLGFIKAHETYIRFIHDEASTVSNTG